MTLAELPFADSVPLSVRHSFVHSSCLYTPEQIDVAVDRLAVQLTVDWQDQNPVCVVWGESSMVFAGMLLQRMIFPLQLVLDQGDENSVDENLAGRRVLVLTALLNPAVMAQTKSRYTNQGAIDVSVAALVCPSLGLDGEAFEESQRREADYVGIQTTSSHLLGCGLTLEGYGANAPGLYQIESA